MHGGLSHCIIPNTMTAILAALRDKPVGLFKLDDTAPFQDYSGFSASGVMDIGAAGISTALMSGANNSTVFNSANVGKFTAPVFRQGHEDKPFSLEAWVYVSDKGSNAEIQILSNDGVLDGLTIEGTKVYFTTEYTATGSARAEYDLQVPRRFYVVGVHTEDKNMLFVDGLLVDEIEITEEQKTDTFASVGGELFSGSTVGGDSIGLNGVGLYASSLTVDSVARHFAVGNNHMGREVVATAFAGLRIPLSLTEADVFLEQTWDSGFDWESAYLTDVVVEDELLKPALIAGASVAGTWLDSFAMDATEATSISGVSLSWDGVGAIVEASLDGVVWETAVRGKNLALITPGFDPTDKELELRISFPGGVSEDPAYVKSLTVSGFKSSAAPVVTNRTITLPGNVGYDAEPVEMRDDWGTDLDGGTLTIGTDASPDAVNPQTVEVWLKRNTASAPTFSANLSTGVTGYSNGVAGSGNPRGEWVLLHFVNAGGISGNITISGDVSVGQVVLYEVAKTAAQVKDIHDSYIGLPRLQVIDASTVSVTEPNPAAVIYDHDWSISAAG